MGFLSDALSFEKFNLKEMAKSIKDDPERLFLGALTPIGSEVWGGITGKDYESPTNMFGGPSDETWERAEAAGINTDSARLAHDVAESIAATYTAGYGLDKMGSAGDAIGNASRFRGVGGGGSSSDPRLYSDDEANRLRSNLMRETYRGSGPVSIQMPQQDIQLGALPSVPTAYPGPALTGGVQTMAQQRPPQIEELMQKYGNPTNGAATYPEGALKGPGLDVETIQSPGQSPALAPVSNGQANAAPAAAQPNGSQAGAGGTSARDTILGQDPKLQLETAEQSVQAVSSKTGKTAKEGGGAEQKKQLNESLKQQGVDPKDAFDDLYKQELETLEKRHKSGEITKREYKGFKNRWKNLFNTIPEEDFGLFLMDFGLRMMAASGQGETLGTSIGTAGQGALQGALGRKQQKQDASMQLEQTAFDRAHAKAGLARDRDSQIESTNSGLIERGPDGQWRPIVNPETGKPYQRNYASDRPYGGKEVYVTEQLKKAGFTDDEIAMVQAGGLPRRVMKQELFQKVMSKQEDAEYLDEIEVGGQVVRLKKATPAQLRLYTEELLDQLYGPSEQQGALQ